MPFKPRKGLLCLVHLTFLFFAIIITYQSGIAYKVLTINI